MGRCAPDSKAPDSQSWVIAGLCAYEVAAILSRERLPTISRLQSRFRPAGWALVTWMVIHFIRYEERRAEVIASEVADELMGQVEKAASEMGEGGYRALLDSNLPGAAQLAKRLRLRPI